MALVGSTVGIPIHKPKIDFTTLSPSIYPTVNMRPTHFWPYLTRFFYPKVKTFGIFRRNFPNPKVADPTQPKQQRYDRRRSKIIGLDPSLISSLCLCLWLDFFKCTIDKLCQSQEESIYWTLTNFILKLLKIICFDFVAKTKFFLCFMSL